MACGSDLQDVVSELWPLARCEIFGSGLTGILTPHSDLDIGEEAQLALTK